MREFACLITLCAVLTSPSLLAANATDKTTPDKDETDKKKEVVEKLKNLSDADLSVPDSPAMTVLGLTGSDIQRPSTPRELAAALVHGVDRRGHPSNGLSIDFLPVPLFAPSLITGGETYEKSWAMQWLARTTISLAAADASGDKGATQTAAGIRIGLLDMGDMGLHWKAMHTCANAAVSKMEPRPLDQEKEADWEAKTAATVKLINDCPKNEYFSNLHLWAQPALYVGYGQSWYSSTGSLSEHLPSKKVGWASFSIGHAPLADSMNGIKSLFQLYGQRSVDDRVKDPTGTDALVNEDRSDFVARLKFGRKIWHAFLDGGVSRVNTANVDTQNVRRFGYGVELRLGTDDMWLVFGGVQERGYIGDQHQSVNMSVRFGQASNPLFDPAP